MPQIKKQVPKWAPFRKQLFPPDWTSYNKIWMTDFQGVGNKDSSIKKRVP